ncbi:hypothetical protein QX215_20155 [Chryseobacterium gambrini]|nr:hypothetical protein [Chryseobacterium gambrini]
MLNSLLSGVKDNHETRIRTTDPEAVAKIIEEVKEVFYHSNLPERDIQFWEVSCMKNPLIKTNGEFALQSMVNFFIMIISIMLNSLRSKLIIDHSL